MSAMAHGGPSAMATHQQTSFGGKGGAGPPPGTTAAPSNVAALGADLLDKNQNLNWKQIRNVAEMPIVSVDLYGDTAEVSYFPPVSDEDEMKTPDDWIKARHLGPVSKEGSSLVFNKDNDTAHRALRKLLNKSKGYEAVFKDTFAAASKSDSASMKITSPHLLLGARQISHLHKATLAKFAVGEDSSHVIDEDTSAELGDGLTIRNGNLDGSTETQNNDFDRVTLNLHLHSKKKSLTVLPEEAVSIVLAKAKQLASKKFEDGEDEDEEEDAEGYLEYPPAIALPAWACNDNAIDSLMDACHGTNAVLYNRSVAALSGAFIPRIVTDEKKVKLQNPKIYDVIMERLGEHAKKTQIAQQQEKPLPNTSFSPMVIMAGLTNDGLELTAIEVKNPNSNYMQGDTHVPFGELKVVSSVSFQHSNPLSIIGKSFCALTDIIDDVCPELEDDGGIAAIITYGTIEKQLKMKTTLTKTLKSIEGDAVWNADVTFASTREEAVAVGTSVLAAVSYSRINPESKSEKMGRPSVEVKNVAPCAVGISYNFHGGKQDSWTEPKIIFDYDRRVPAGPSITEFSAAECVALKENPKLLEDTEKLVEEAQKWNKGKFNSLREEAALNMRVRVMQRVERDGKWRLVGNVMKALAKKDGGEEDEESKPSAIETATLELSLDSMGFITANLVSDGQSIEQALKSAKSSTFWYWFRIIAVVGFVGGFLVKSFVEDRIRERDVTRVLKYYKHVAPGTISDGDRHNAYYLCWKYKNKKDKLWKKLEHKYGVPVLQTKEYEAIEAEEEAAAAAKAASEPEEVDLDEEENTSKGGEEEL